MSAKAESGVPRPWRVIGLVPAVLVAAIAVWEIGAPTREARSVPSESDWDAATEHVRARYTPGDLIVFAPAWVDPIGREHIGDLIPIEAAARMDAARYGVIWEISARGARSFDTRDLPAVEPVRFGKLTVRRFEREPARIVTDFLAEAARFRSAGGARPQVSLEEVGFEPHRCIKLVPPPDGTLRISLPEAELGTRLVGYVGLADVFTRRDVRAPARLDVRVDGAVVASTTVGVDDGWVRFEAATREGPAEVAFEATAIGKNARERLVCFAAEARR